MTPEDIKRNDNPTGTQDNEYGRNGHHGLTRRDFLALTGAGLFIFFPIEELDAQQQAARGGGRGGQAPTDFNAWLRIAPDNRVTGFVGKVELGQGPMTSLAQMLAEELEVSVDSVDMVMGDTDLCPYDTGTFGSMSIRFTGPPLRAAGAEAKAVLLQMAAERLNLPVERLQAKAGVISDKSAPNTRVTYGQLVEGKRIERHMQNVPLKPVSAFTVIGTSPRRKDALEKVTGKAKYAGDFRLPGMLHARILRPPAHDATLKSVDTSAAERVEGVRVVKEGDLIAVLHERRDIADKALGLVKAEWDRKPPAYDDRSIYDHLEKSAGQPRADTSQGDLEAGAKQATVIVEQTYWNAYVAHAPIEPHVATANIENGKLTVWSSTQAPFSVKGQVAQATGFEPQNVRIITPYVGGGFGGKSGGRQSPEAARLAKITGKPVQVMFDRDEEFFYDTYRPAAVMKVRSGVNAAGKIVLWDFYGIGEGTREIRHFYDIPNTRITSAGGWQGGNPGGMHPFGVGPWRAPSVNSNTFARESQIDIMASKAGTDPVEFRRNNLVDKRMLRVLEAGAKQFGWKPAKAPSGRGVAVCLGIDSGTYCATFGELTVDKNTGHVQVKRIVCAEDAGVVISPDGLKQQMEGCITMSLGYALTEGLRFKGGEILDKNFDTYEIPRFSWVPKIETILIDNPETTAQGGGEPPIFAMGALVASAIHDLLGVRLLELPMTPERIRAALKKA